MYYEKYIEDKIARETKELKNQQIELENKLQRLEREENAPLITSIVFFTADI